MEKTKTLTKEEAREIVKSFVDRNLLEVVEETFDDCALDYIELLGQSCDGGRKLNMEDDPEECLDIGFEVDPDKYYGKKLPDNINDASIRFEYWNGEDDIYWENDGEDPTYSDKFYYSAIADILPESMQKRIKEIYKDLQDTQNA